MAGAFGHDRRIEAYAGKRPIGLCRWDAECLLDVMDLALRTRSHARTTSRRVTRL
jgi:hypothetical protein